MLPTAAHYQMEGDSSLRRVGLKSEEHMGTNFRVLTCCFSLVFSHTTSDSCDMLVNASVLLPPETPWGPDEAEEFLIVQGAMASSSSSSL